MAITNLLDGVLNDSLTNQVLVENLIANSTYLSNTQGIVDGTLTSGKIVKNSLLTQPTANAYTGADITVANADDTSKPITVNQAAEFSAKILDIDIDQSFFTHDSLQMEFAKLGVRGLQNTIDNYALTQAAAGAGASGTTVANITAANVEAYMAEGIELLMKENVSANEVIAFVPYYVYSAAQQAGGVQTETAQSAFSQGKVLDFMGAKVILNNNLDSTTNLQTDAESIFTTSWATQYVIGGTTTESTRIEKNFGSIIKGLMLYGAGVLQPGAVVNTVVGK